MKRNLAGAAAVSVLALSTSLAAASTLPAIKVDARNQVPECATPGRMMAYVGERNAKLDPRYAGLATHYMRHGEQMGIRWDYAFFQMILETGSLSYTRNGTKPGDVKPRQNNFAGIGATGNGAPGEAFATIEDGVRAHLQHLQMYSGEQVESPIAERTRKVQEWGVLTSWQKGIKRPITFTDLAAKWAPGSRGYASNIGSIAQDFLDGTCKRPDPRPELVQEARAGRKPVAAATTRTAKAAAPERRQPISREPSIGEELARAANERARSEGDGDRAALGAGAGQVVAAKPYAGESAPIAGITILNERPASPPTEPAAEVQQPAEPPARTPPAAVQAASAAAIAKSPSGKSAGKAQQQQVAAVVPKPPAASPAPSAETPAQAGRCRVYTASYGGQKAVIIRAAADQFTNFTVLDVNEGQEAREVEAYISAYAKGGSKVGEFATSNAALDKAFQLCPEG